MCKWPILKCCAGRGMVFVLSVLNRVYNSAKVYPKPVYMSFVLNGVYQGRRLKKAIYVFYQLLVLKRCCVEFAFLVLGTSTWIAIWMIPTRSLLDFTIFNSLFLHKEFKCLANEDTNSEVPTVSAIKEADWICLSPFDIPPNRYRG